MIKEEYEFDYLIFIGRFQPYHKGHHDIVTKALKKSKNLIIVPGSHDRARDIRNPFSTYERIEIIKSAIEGKNTELLPRILFAPQVDHPYNETRWISDIQSSVRTIIFNKFSPDKIKIGIIGYNKDHSSYYLKKFPAWTLVEIQPTYASLNATDFRQMLFYEKNGAIKDFFVNKEHEQEVLYYTEHIEKYIYDEWSFVEEYKNKWKNSPYPVTLQTVDAVVSQSGHVLLIERGAMPGQGLFALPGGYIGQNETLRESMLRELKEETKIDVPLPVLAGSIRRNKTYDDPRRSVRGRVITQAFDIRLNDNYKLPGVKGSDDARKAFWVPVSEVVSNRTLFFEDHFDIIEDMLGL